MSANIDKILTSKQPSPPLESSRAERYDDDESDEDDSVDESNDECFEKSDSEIDDESADELENKVSCRRRPPVDTTVVKPKLLRKKAHDRHRKKSPEPCNEQLKSGFNWMYTLVIPIIILAIFFVNQNLPDNVHVPTDNPSRLENFKKDIADLKARFKHQGRFIWGDISAGVSELILNPVKPSILFFFSEDDYPMSCLANMVGNISKAALGTPEFLKISPAQMGNDYGEVIEKFRDEIDKYKVVIIENVLDIHPEAMQAFHNLCDRITPLVSDALYIFTMVAKGYDNSSALEFVENQLTKKMMGNINVEKLDPLITRMTDSALIPVQPEPTMKTCPLRY